MARVDGRHARMRDARRLPRPPSAAAGRLRHGPARGRPGAAGLRPRRLPGQRRPGPGERGRAPAAPGGRGGCRGGLTRRHLLGGGGQRPRLHQPDPVGRLRGRAGGHALGRPQAGRGRGRTSRDHRHRLLGPERGQGDARRASAQHPDRRRAGSRAGVLGPRRAAGEPHRRLGHALRHADRAPDRRGRGAGCRVVQRARPQRVLRRRRAGSSTATPSFAERSRRRVVLAAER